MVQVSFPGVYIREVPSGVRTITGVATSVAVFVGEVKRGQTFEPTRVLGFTDYERIFSSDTTLSEMTDQVQQFFLNGGQQAFIVRITNETSAAAAAITLQNNAGADVLRLTAKSAGLDGNSLRARVDYNTSSPERTFNLTLYREVFSDAGVPQVLNEEVFTELSMDAVSSRSVETVLGQQSALATAELLTVTPGQGFSASGRLFADATALNAAVTAAIQATAPGGSGTTGMFRIKLGAEPFRTVPLTAAAVGGAGGATGAIAAAINALGGPQVEVDVIADGSMIIRALDDIDVIVERGTDRDIAVALQLGAGQGGLEVGAFADDRPAPNGYLSQVGDVTNATIGSLLGTLLEFAGTDKVDLTGVRVNGSLGFPAVVTTFVPLTFAGAGDMATNGAAGRSLKNVAARLATIADAINGATTDWRAEVHGFRLALIPRFGDANAGTTHVIESDGAYDLAEATGTPNLFGGTGGQANVSAYSLGTGAGDFQVNATAGNDGTPPVLADYQRAFAEIDEKVDLFNLMILPRSAPQRDTANIRASIWGAASAFCQQHRAFLIVDAGPTATGVEEVLTGLADLRAGVVKDHAAVYWPQIRIPVNGSTKAIDPSGTIAGLMARIDANRGVWKAPAGLEADLRGVRGVAVPMSDAQNGLLNPQAVNAIRAFPNGIVSWGARTMDGFDNSGNNDYKYVPVRRFALFIEESLYRGLKFAVFEPNDEPLWAQIRLAVGAFMNNLFRQSAFAGRTTRESYFVKVDAETTTQNDINLGIVNVVVGFAPLKPAEFIVVTIKQQAGQVQV